MTKFAKQSFYFATALLSLTTQASAISSSDIFADMNESFKRIEENFNRLRSEFWGDDVGIKNIEKGLFEVKETGLEDEKSKNYQITFILPGFKQEDINVTIYSDEKNGKTSHRLELAGTKKTTTESDAKTENNDKTVTVKTIKSQAFTSATLINGRQKLIKYKDGKLEIKLELPADIDIKSGSYSMKFDEQKEALTIEFPKKGKGEKNKMTLEYTDKK